MAIGFFGQGDVMRQVWYRNAERYRGMPLSSFAQGTVVDVGQMPGSVVPVQSVGGWGSPGAFATSGYGVVTPGTILTAGLTAVAPPIGAAAFIANQKSLAHAQKMCQELRKHYKKLKAKGADAKKLAKVKAKYEHWCKVAAHHAKVKAARKDYRAFKKEERPAFRKQKKAIRRGDYSLATGAEAAAAAGLASSSAAGAMVPPGSYDFAPAAALPSPDTSAVEPAALARGPGSSADSADAGDDAGTMTAPSGGGIMGLFSAIPTWGWVVGIIVAGGLIFSKTATGRRMLRRLTKKGWASSGPTTTGAAAAAE